MIVILFGIIATLGLAAALGTVLAKNLVHAALFLVAFFFIVACMFVLLEAEFMAAMQVLVYIGAVAIILMFGIMLTRNIQGDETTGGSFARKIPGAIVAAALLTVLLIGIFDQKGTGSNTSWKELDVRPTFHPPTQKGPSADPRSAAIGDMGRAVGNEMLQRYLIGFEIAGLLLTAALVGAVVLAQAEESEIPRRLGPSADFRGTTTAEPEVGLPPLPSETAPSTLANAKLSPSSDATQS